MGFGDFQLNNNGKKEVLQNAKNGVRKEQVDKKFHNLFDAYDINKDGTLETNELNEIFNGLNSFAGDDKVLDTAENQLVQSVFAEKMNLQNADFMGFVKSVSTASADIVSSKETPTADGGKEVVTTYKDGTTETIAYYPDGEYKFKKVDAKTVSTSYYYIVGNNLNKKYTAQQVEDVIKDAYKHENHAITTRSGEKTTEIARLSYKDFKKVYMSRNNIKKLMATSESERHDLELSERAKQDVAVRDFVLSHYIETHKAAKEALESMGILDNAGALINAGAGEVWNAIKNKWNGTEEEYQNFYELKDKFAPNNKKLETLQQTQGFVQRNQDEYFKSYETSFQENFGQKYDLEISTKFQAKAEQYQNAQILKERLNLLKTAMDEVEQYQVDQGLLLHSPATSEGINPASHIVKANELLLQYFGGDQNAVDMILNGAMGDENAKVVQAIKDIYNDTQKMNEAVLGGKSFDEIQDEYKTQYKEMYNTDFVPDDLTEKVMDAKATGSMVKLAAITIISVLITRSPIMAEINGAIAGGAEATGAAANLVKTLVAKYGQNAVAQGIKFAMTSGTLATDVGLTLLNQVTSERGVNGEELWESTKSSAKFIYFGAYVGGPLAQAVSKQFGKIGVAAKMFEGGAKTSNGAVQTTTIAGDKLMQNLMKGGNIVLTKGSAFLTDVAAFTALEVATDGQDVATAGKEQLEFLPKLKIMNGIIEYMLGGKVHAGMVKAKMDAAIEQSGVKNWEIKEIKSPTKSMYEVKIDKDMPPIRFENANDLATAMSEAVAGKYEKLNEAKADTKQADKNPNPQGVREQGEVRTEGIKKPYIAPSTVRNNYALSEPLLASEVATETTAPKINNILDKVFDETTIPKTKSRLKEMGFTEEEINSIDFKDANVQRTVEVLSTLFKFKSEMKEESSNADIAEFLSNKEELENFLKEDAKLFTAENCEILDKNVIFDDDGDIVKILSGYNNPEKLMNLLPILTQNGKHKVFGSQLQLLGSFLDTPEDIAKITPEKVDLMYKINDQIENKKYGIELDEILNLDNISSELANDYVKEANRFSKYEIENISEKTLEETVAKRKAVSDFLEQYPIDLTCKDYRGNLSKLSGGAVYRLSQRTNKAEVQKFVNSLSEEARNNYADYSKYVDKGFSAEKLSNLINEYQKGDFGEIQGDIYELLDKMLETGSKDYDSMIDLINAYKDTRVLSWYGNDKYVQVANGDFKGAIKYIELAKELGMNKEHFNYLIANKDADFKTVEACLTYVKENKIDLSNYDDYCLLRDNNWKENFAKIEYLRACKVERLQDMHGYICNDFKSNISFDEFKAKFEFVDSYAKNNANDIKRYLNDYMKIKIANSDLSAKELEDFCQQTNLTPQEKLDVLAYTNKVTYNFALSLSNNKDFPVEQIANVLRFIHTGNIEFAEKLCNKKEFPKEFIPRIINAVSAENLSFAEKICSDIEFPKEQVANILNVTNSENIVLAEKLCAEKEIPAEYIADILKQTNIDNLSFATKLCSDREFPYASTARILRVYDGGSDAVISAAKSGLLQKYPDLLGYKTSMWGNIIKRNLMELPAFKNNAYLIRIYTEAKNDNIEKLHGALVNDAQANKDLLKSGLDDITDADINKVMNSKEAVKTIDIIGLGNTEAAFPLMLEEFEYFTRDVVQLSDKLSAENRELLAQKLTPECSEKYSTLNQEIINLKKQLNNVVGTENLAKIKGLQAQKTKIDEQMKNLKQSDNANTPEAKQQLKEMQKQSKALGAQAQAIYYQGENANQVKEIMKQISTKSKELKTFVQEKTGLEPQDVVTKVRVLSAMQEISTPEEMAEFINMIKPSTPENDAVWNDAVNKKIFQKLRVEFDEQLSQKLDLIHCKYLSKMFVSSDGFFDNMKILVDTIKENPELTIEQALDGIPQNIETKNMYKELGIDYDKWTKVDKNSYTSVEIKLNAEEAKQAAIHNLEEDLNDALFKTLPNEVTEPIFEQLKEKLGVTFEKSQKDNWVGDGFSAGTTEYYRLMKDGKPITFEDMNSIVSTIKKEILNNNFWTTTNADSNIENARGTLYTHLIKMRTQEVDNAMSLKDGETSEIEIRKTDMYDIKKALGLGNDAQCCTALGRQFNEWSAPTYIMNKCIGAIELTDKGTFVGNTMTYIAYVDGKPALVLDNIELKTKYHNNDKIRDTFVDYAKKLCEEIGQPDLPIYAGPNRHKLNMDVFPKTKHSMLPIGSTSDQRVYLDYDASGHEIGPNENATYIDMYKIR